MTSKSTTDTGFIPSSSSNPTTEAKLPKAREVQLQDTANPTSSPGKLTREQTKKNKYNAPERPSSKSKTTNAELIQT